MFWYPIFNKKYVDDLQQKGSIIIICGKCVYDFTKYVNNNIHPGGNDIIERLSNSGNDCSNDYNFHNTAAMNVWNKYFIGYLET
jgi:cytochrome b involved in lipid metabolism